MWGNDHLFTNSYIHCPRPRVRKSRWTQAWKAKWIVTNHPCGVRAFSTWREAMDYATMPLYTFNKAG